MAGDHENIRDAGIEHGNLFAGHENVHDYGSQ